MTGRPNSDSALTEIGAALRERQGRPHDQARSMPAAFYTSAAFLELERAQLFKREWICVGREDEVAEPGDYMAFDLLEEPVLVLRGDDGKVRALSNVCRHRGMLIAEGRGRARRLACPYHAWTYDRQGQLVGAPHMDERPDFDLGSICLPEFRSEVWQGFIFVTLAADTPPLAPRLAGLEALVRNYHLEEQVLRHVSEAVWETNWKCLMENFMEGYHLSPLHRKTLHPVNPTRLCRHIQPGEAYFAYHAGFSPELERTTRGHPDLTEEEADACVMFAVPPALAVGAAADYSSFISIQPETADSVRVKQGLYFHGDHWTEEAVERAVLLFEETMAEDKAILTGVRRGLHAKSYGTGPLAPADYEGPIWDFIQYMARRLLPNLPAKAGKVRALSG